MAAGDADVLNETAELARAKPAVWVRAGHAGPGPVSGPASSRSPQPVTPSRSPQPVTPSRSEHRRRNRRPRGWRRQGRRPPSGGGRRSGGGSRRGRGRRLRGRAGRCRRRDARRARPAGRGLGGRARRRDKEGRAYRPASWRRRSRARGRVAERARVSLRRVGLARDRHQQDVSDSRQYENHDLGDEDGRVPADRGGRVADRVPDRVGHHGASDAGRRQPGALPHARAASRPAQSVPPLHHRQTGKQVDDRVPTARHGTDM
jgi:hypothetical protein